MLTIIPNPGDEVVIAYKTEYHPKIECVTIDKVGHKYIYVGRCKFHLNGKGENPSGYELFDSYDAWTKSKQRDLNISKIKRAVSAWSFGNGLSDEALEQIAELIEVKL